MKCFMNLNKLLSIIFCKTLNNNVLDIYNYTEKHFNQNAII